MSDASSPPEEPKSPAEPKEPLWEVHPGISLLPLRTPTLPPATRTNSYLIGGPRGGGAAGPVLLVEPATPDKEEQERLLGWLREKRIRVGALFCTHHHGDHVGGAEALRRALRVPLWAHPKTAERLRGELRFDRLIEDGERLDQSRELGPNFPQTQAIHTPGHAPGHLCLLVGHGPERALIAGDMVAGIGTILVEPKDGDMALYLRSLERMIALRPSLLLPAHGPPIEEAEATLRRYIAHRLQREAKVLVALREHEEERAAAATPMALVPSAYAEVPPFLWPLAAHSVEAHLIKLERDGLARREEQGWRPSAA